MSLTVFQTKLVRATPQLIAKNLNVFNQASNGTLMLGSGDVLKDTIETMVLGLISGLVQDRNPYAAPGTSVDQLTVARLLTNSVSISGRVGPVTITNAQARKIETNVDEVAADIAAQAAQAIIEWHIQRGVGAAAAAISTSDGSGSGANKKPLAVYTQAARKDGVGGRLFPTLGDFPLAASLFGDYADAVSAWFMNGVQWANFIAYQAIPSAEQVFAIGNLKVLQDGLGRRFVISDAVGDALPANTLLGLVPGAVQITTNGLTMAADQVTGEENIRQIWQGEFDSHVAVKGYRTTAAYRATIEGIKGATLAELKTKANWELDQGQVSTAKTGNTGTQAAPKRDVKETAGILLNLTATTA